MFPKIKLLIWIKNYFLKFFSIFFFQKIIKKKRNNIMVIVCKDDLIIRENFFSIRLLDSLLKEIKKYKKLDYNIIFHKYTYLNKYRYINKNYMIENLFFFLNDNLKSALKFFNINFSREKDYWENILRQFSPVAIFTISAPNDILKVAEKNKIPLYEFQHGIIDTKINYFKNLINFLKKNKKSKYVKFIAWNNNSKNYFNSKIERNNTLVYKDPHLESKIEFKKKFKNKVILISLANNLEYFYDLYKIKSNLIKFTIPKFLIDFIIKDRTFTWIFRFHPSQSFNKNMFHKSWQFKFIDEIFQSKKNVFYDYKFSKTNLKTCLLLADYHIADSSAALMTSESLNIKSGCWNMFLSNDKNRVEQFNVPKKSIISVSNKKKLEYFLEKKNKKKINLRSTKFDYKKFISKLNIDMK